MQWYTLASTAKKSGSPYAVNEMEGHMMDFKLLGEAYCKNLREAVSCKVPQWQKIRAIRVEKESPHVLFVKYAFDEESFIPLVDRLSDSNSCATLHLSPMGNESTVSKAKKDDLLYMCRELIIPKEYHQFYKDLVLGRTNDMPESNTSTPPETVSGVHNDTRNSGRSEQPNCRARRNTRKSNGNSQLKETTTKKTTTKKIKSTAGSSNTKSGSQKKRNVLSASISLEMQRSATARKKKLDLSLPLTM